MPMVNGKKYPYTKAGKKAAQKAKRAKKSYGGRTQMKHGGKAEAMPKATPC